MLYRGCLASLCLAAFFDARCFNKQKLARVINQIQRKYFNIFPLIVEVRRDGKTRKNVKANNRRTVEKDKWVGNLV